LIDAMRRGAYAHLRKTRQGEIIDAFKGLKAAISVAVGVRRAGAQIKAMGKSPRYAGVREKTDVRMLALHRSRTPHTALLLSVLLPHRGFL
jgi:hypothetical protein